MEFLKTIKIKHYNIYSMAAPSTAIPAIPSPENPIPDILSPENLSPAIPSAENPIPENPIPDILSMDITTRIQEVFNEPEITNQTIYLSTDLEPDDMMAIKLLAQKFKKCNTLYVVIGEHTLGDIKNKCYLFYYLATLYGFDHKICISTTTNKPIIFTGHPSAEENFYPSTIFNKEIPFNGDTKKLADHFADSIDIIDITTTMTRDCLHNKLIVLNPIPIFILMKPPKEFFYPERYGNTFQKNVAIMYGSFNVTELNKFMTLKKMDTIGLPDIISIFPEIVYIERKPEVAIYPQEVQGKKLEPIDPNPFFGTFNTDNEFKILGDTKLLSKIKAAYDAIVGLESEDTNFLKYCTRQWQLTTLTKVGTLLNIEFIDENKDKIDVNNIDELINFFKRTYFQDTIPTDANFQEVTEGYYPQILDIKKLYDSKTKLSLSEEAVPFDTLSNAEKLDEAKKIAKELKKNTKNKWGMMIGIVLTNGEQTPLADQIIAAVILEPQSFTIKKITRDKTNIHTILCSESIQDIEKLKSDLLNNDKLQLYKTILDIITKYSKPVSDSVEQNVAVKVLPRNMTQADRINVLKRYNSRRLQSATSRGGKKRTKKRNHKKTINEEPKPKRKQEQTRKKKRHSMTSDS
jgi:hypothetical protein